jgi:hypothetical protein
MRCATVQPDGQLSIGAELTFDDCRRLVGGDVEVVRLHDDVCCFVNEDGKALGLEPNPLATEFCRRIAPGRLHPGDVIKGTMVVFGTVGEDEFGDITPAAEGALVVLYANRARAR